MVETLGIHDETDLFMGKCIINDTPLFCSLTHTCENERRDVEYHSEAERMFDLALIDLIHKFHLTDNHVANLLGRIAHDYAVISAQLEAEKVAANAWRDKKRCT